MEQCTQCGHALGIGRYCVNCGHPTGAAEGGQTGQSGQSGQPAPPTEAISPPTELSEPTQAPWGPTTPTTPPPPAAPPPVYETPPRARYPMYADEPTPSPATPPETPAWESFPGSLHDERRRSVLPWVLGAVALLAFGAIGVFLLLGGAGGDDDQAADPARGGDGDLGTSETTGPGTPDASTPTGTDPTDPTEPETSTPPVEGEAGDVGRLASVIPPDTAAPGTTVDGNAVRYDGFNMLDGQDDTAWRMPGDGTGQLIAFELAGPVHLTSVGLVNGYAKVDPGYDGYTANRRVLAVTWTFDDGTTVSQTLDGDDRALQSIDVDVVTSTVQLTMDEVSRPGRGAAGRDYTAISTVSLVGVPQG